MKAAWVCAALWLALSLAAGAGDFEFSWRVFLSYAVTVGVLYIAASASRARGWPLFWMLTVLYGGIGVVNIQIESFAFGISPLFQTVRDTALQLIPVVLAAAVLAIGMTRGVPPDTSKPAPGLARRVWLRMAAVSLSYLVLYFVAGGLIYPFVKPFYDSNSLIVIPSFGVIVSVQILRGLVYAASIAPLMRTMAGRRGHAALVAGLALAVFGGIAPLLLPVDDILPPEVRAVHMIEILCSNFMLGVIGALLLVRRAPSPRAVSADVPDHGLVAGA